MNRYGAQILPDHYVIDESEIKIKAVNYPGKVVMEVVTKDTENCLLKSIPVKGLFKDSSYSAYRKVLLKNPDYLKEYSIKEYSCLLFFDNGVLKGKIEGTYSIGQEKELIEKIKEIK